MTTYTINHNDQYNSLEIFFDGKPDEAVRSALKGLKFRWHRIKKCWYGFADEEAVRAAIEKDPMDDYTITSREGYMGAVAYDGSNSKLNLYGANLTKAIREAFKKCGIKGVTVKMHSYSGGQSVYFTITPAAGDLVTLEDYIKNSSIQDFARHTWIQDPENNYESIKFDYAVSELPQEELDRLIRANAKDTYERFTSGGNINEYSVNDEKIFTDQFKAKFHKIRQIVSSFNYDDSNSMVDYFNRGFYEHYKLKAC